MLKLIKVHSKNQVWEYFQNFKIDDFEKSTWIVSKTSDRDFMSQYILSTHGYFLDLHVQLNYSFYRMIFERVFPDYKIVSREFAEVFLKRKMLGLKSDLGMDVVDEKSRLRSMTYFASLLFDPDLDRGRLQEWLGESEERNLRLKPDLLLNQLFLNFFIEDKIICEDWVVAQLQSADVSSLKLPIDKLFFDLGVDYGLMESTLLRKLAINHEITLFQNVHDFDQNYNHLIQAYERFDTLENRAKGGLSENHIELKKFSSAVSESRFAVSQIKAWHQQGAAWSEMAIVAPDIHKYQDVLLWQLLAEDVPVNQSKKSFFMEFQDVRELLSDLSFFKREIEFSSVKESLLRYYSEEKVGPFKRIEEKLNSPFLTPELFLNLVEQWVPGFFKRHMGMTLDQLVAMRTHELSVGDFIKKTQIFWERTGLGERKEKIINALFDSSSTSIKLSVEEWIEQIEKVALQSQTTVVVKQAIGIQMTSLSQVSLFNLKNAVVIGLEESGFQSQFKEAIPTDDIFNMNSELGVYLEHPDLSVSSYQLEDLLAQVKGHSILSYPYKAIDSSIQNPAPLWQMRAFAQKLFEKEMDSPEAIQWDMLIQSSGQWLGERGQEYKADVQGWDVKPIQLPKLSDFSLGEISLSPSSIQTFLDCRQKFFFQRVLKLRSIESESFDINAREKGSWYHSLFEKIVKSENEYIQPFVVNGLNDELRSQLLSRLQVDFAEIIPQGFSEGTWNLVKKSYFENVIKFIDHEIGIRRNFPELKNIAVEWPWEIFYDWKQFEFSKSPSENTIRISGVIDRILLNQKTNQLWLVDYKSSLSNYSPFSAWIANKEFQLLLYSHIVQNHCSESWSSKVENLSYWHLPDLHAKKGFAVFDPRLTEMGYSKKSLGSMEEKEKVEAEFLLHFQEMITQMKDGHFFPIPSEEKTCRYCEWRLGCRAPHL